MARRQKFNLTSLGYLKSRLHYDSETGCFTWLRREEKNHWHVGWNKRWAGKSVAYINPEGYLEIALDGVHYKGHRLAWFYMRGEWPKSDLDHVDYDRSNCRWANLREANKAQNMQNRSKTRINTSGFKGVTFEKQTQRWKAQIQSHGKALNLGRYNTPEEAHAVYAEAARRLHGEFARVF